jgi:hypothetical protein
VKNVVPVRGVTNATTIPMDAIRFDEDHQRVCLPDVLGYMLNRHAADHLTKRETRRAKDNGMTQLIASFQRPDRQVFKPRESNSRSVQLAYLQCPSEFVQIATEYLQYYIEATKSTGKQSSVLPKLWCNLKLFHSKFEQCFQNMWTTAPLLGDAELQYSDLLANINFALTKVKALK